MVSEYDYAIILGIKNRYKKTDIKEKRELQTVLIMKLKSNNKVIETNIRDVILNKNHIRTLSNERIKKLSEKNKGKKIQVAKNNNEWYVRNLLEIDLLI